MCSGIIPTIFSFHIMSGGILTLSVETRQRAEGRRLQGKEKGCKAQGNNDCLGGHDIITDIR
ncbi:hypothetical protein [Coleofasciculus sp. C1-SOL-03]|uniref:hypothetical protein n=1 Tax=Coleofasciculus sp. C1-SOL-03 TaxID=3069522 RepID=UPI004063D451